MSVFFLFVASPAFVIAPRNKVVGVGRRLSVKCVVTGSPLPAVYWSKVASQVGGPLNSRLHYTLPCLSVRPVSGKS